jgi:hypothetical protein
MERGGAKRKMASHSPQPPKSARQPDSNFDNERQSLEDFSYQGFGEMSKEKESAVRSPAIDVSPEKVAPCAVRSWMVITKSYE